MINFFKALNPLNIVGLVVILFALRIGYLINGPAKIEFAFAGQYARLLLPVPGQYTITPFFNVLLAAVIVFIQALLLNHLVNHFNLLGKPTFLPALMYITVSALFMPFLVLSPPLLCNFLVIWMLFKLLSFYKNNDAKSVAYDLGMLVAIGSIIYPPFIYFFLAIWVALIIFKPFNWREGAAGVMGYITIFFFLAVYYYLNDSLGQFYTLWEPLGTKFPDNITINYYNYLVLVPVILILVLCFFTLQRNFFRSYVQVRKSFQLLFVIFLIGGLSFYIKAAFHLNHFLLCVVPVAVFFSYYFLYAKRKWFYETLFAILLIGIIYFQFNNF
ncbi:MAG: beta-carotene 15,15-monooxygenase [Mucilaginibacter sp.]|jgi:hypothetical protein|nr:beta-carotene 15,15-monooxygenase [Mucilaginibacter sp.]MDB5015602.1 beta-carotene 15,15-monooxygenase [Mucilaginibacter sp.]MDB5140669.1 beta-carotene 15,15-monooxygenase [Mucilaginibacter sp.]